MVDSTKEKEEAIEKLNTELAASKRKLEEDSVQESRSDPESVTSSLTSDTNGTHHRHSRSNNNNHNSNKKQKLAQHQQQKQQQLQKNNTTSSHNMSSVSMNEESSGGGEDRTSRGSGTGSGSGSGGSGSGSPSAQGFSVDKTDNTGVSDITDSNRASSSNTYESSSANPESTSRVSVKQKRDQGGQLHSNSSICSDAAVASLKTFPGQDDGQHQHNHKDVVFTNGGTRSHRKRSAAAAAAAKEVSSLDKEFELDYEEIFTMSNVPQLIATTAGKIVTWNQCFLRATGIRKSEVERMTIFSLVKPEKLSNFFEIVAHALKDETPRSNDDDTTCNTHSKHNHEDAANDDDGASSKGTEKPSSESDMASTTITPSRTDYAAMTLPCVEFPGMRKRREKDGSKQDDPLHVTVRYPCLFLDCQ